MGQEFPSDPAVPGKVVSVSETGVLVRFTAEPGKEVDTAFGKGTIRETPDHYEIAIDAHPVAFAPGSLSAASRRWTTGA